MTNPVELLREATRAVPAVRYALGLGGVIATIAIVYLFNINARVAFVGTIVVLIFMGVLVIFARMAALAGPQLLLPAQIFTWFVLVVFMAVTISLFTSVFFKRPLDLARWLTGSVAIDIPDTGSEHLRLVVQSVMFEQRPNGPYAWADMSLANIGSEAVLLKSVSFGVVATAVSDGSPLAKVFYMAKNLLLPKGAITPLEVKNSPVSPWNQMGNETLKHASFDTHSFTFWIQVRGTIASSGKSVALDIEMPRPARMNCEDSRPCVAVYQLNTTAGASAHKKCAALPAQRDFILACQTAEIS